LNDDPGSINLIGTGIEQDEPVDRFNDLVTSGSRVAD
jgi:hypothetical protein